MNSIKFSFRQLLKRPGFTTVAVITLALGIGANTAIFSVLHAVVLRPFSYPDSDRILFVSMSNRTSPENVGSFSFPNLRDFQNQTDVFEQFGGAMDGSMLVTETAVPSRVKGCYLDPQVFALLKTAPLIGRTLTEEDNQRGAERVAVLNHSAWQRFFGGANDVVGRSLMLNSRPHTVVGVMPPEFKFWDSQVYLPLVHGVPSELERVRGATIGLWGIARLKPDVSLDAANATLDALGRRLEMEYPDTNENAFALARPLSESVSSQLRPTLMLLFGAVAFVLFIACVNVTNLLLARGATRGRELAVRAALGADRREIFKQLLLETLPIAVLGGLLGIALAAGGLQLILSVIPEYMIPAEANIRLSIPVLCFTVAVSLAAALAAGSLPALQGARLNLNEELKDGTRSTGDARSMRLRSGLIVAEVSLALVLLVGAGLLVRDLNRLIQTDLGVDVNRVLMAQLSLPEARYENPESINAFVRELIERIRPLPGVRHVAVARSAPFTGNNFWLPLMIPGRESAKLEDTLSAAYNPATTETIQTLGSRLKEGRLFTEFDRAGSEPVVLMNEAAAKLVFPGSSAVGKQVAVGISSSMADSANVPPGLVDPPHATVVGVVSDYRQFGYLNEPQPEIYVPFEQSVELPGLRNNLALLLRTDGHPSVLTDALRQVLMVMDPNLPADSIQTMSSLASNSLRPQRFVALLLGLFAGVAALLATIGIYSVVAWLVAQRTHEVGIRLALGATPKTVVSRLMRQGLFPVLLGTALGLPAAFALARLMSSQLAQIQSYDPLTYISVALLLIAVAALACWLPARRAARVDPMVALRAE